MRPVDLYVLPTLRTEPWYESYGPIGHFFKDDMLEGDLDREAAREAGDGRLAFEQKLHHYGDGYRTVTYYAVTLDATPVGVLVTAGRGGDDQVTRLVTRLDLYREARAYLDSRKASEKTVESDAVGMEDEVEILSGTYGHRALPGPDGAVRLVPQNHLCEGRLVFDEVAFREHFEAGVRKPFPAESAGFKLGLKHPGLAEAAAAALLSSVPPGLRASAAFEREGLAATPVGRFGWIGVLATDGEHTFAVGVGPYAPLDRYGWSGAIEVGRAGGPELYDALVPASPAPVR